MVKGCIFAAFAEIPPAALNIASVQIGTALVAALDEQKRIADDESRERGIIAIIIGEIDHTESIVKGEFNGVKASVVIDTCSTTSMIEFNDPTQNRIFKVGKRIKYSRICKEKDASTEK